MPRQTPPPTRGQRAAGRPGGWFALVALLLTLAGPVPAGADATGPDLADPQRWSETAYGISLRPPDGWSPLPAPRDGNDFAWQSADGARLAFKIAYSQVPVQLDHAGVQALVQMGFALDNPRLRRGAEQRTLGKRPATVMLFDVEPHAGGTPWFYAHAVIMLEPYAAAVVKIQADPPGDQAALARFEEVLASLHVPLGTELEAMRRPQIDRGVAWLAALPPGTLERAVPQEAWYSLRIHGHHVGHRRVVRVSDPLALARNPELRRLGFVPPGTAVVLQDHRQHQGVALDRSLYAYAEADGEIEIWDLKQTLRPAGDSADPTGIAGLTGPAGRAPGDDPAVTWVETGTRGPRARAGTTSQNIIEVIQETPPSQRTVAGVKAQESFLGSAGAAARIKNDGSVAGRTQHRRWQTPAAGYLGQVQAMGLPAVMPRKPGTVFTFYAWDRNRGELALRTLRVGPDPEGEPGGYVVYERPSPSTSETRHRFAADGTFLETRVAGGLSIVPTTPDELRRRAGGP